MSSSKAPKLAKNNVEEMKYKREVKLAEQAKFESYVYHPTVLPGAFAFAYLLPPQGSAGVSHLKMLIPDTIVVTEDTNDELTAWWYYSDGEGRVRATSEFSKNALINKLGNTSYDNTLAVIHKSARILKTGAKTAVYEGNDINLLTTRQLVSMSNQLALDHSHITRAPTTTLNSQQVNNVNVPKEAGGVGGVQRRGSFSGIGGGGTVKELVPPYVLQRYVKPSGVKASLFRAQLDLDRKLKVFSIAATARYEEVVLGLDRSKEQEIQNVASSQRGPFNKRRNETDFFTASPRGVVSRDATISMTVHKQAGTMDVLSSAKTDTNGQLREGVASSTEMLWGWLQCRLRRALQSLVVDFVRDDAGRLWLLNVKGFQFRCSDPSRPLGRAPDMPPLLKTADALRREQDTQANTYNEHYTNAPGGEAHLRPSENFTMICKCCLVGIAPDEITYHLSQQMVTWLAMHMRSRLPIEKCPAFVQRVSQRVLADHNKDKSKIGSYRDDGGVTHPILGHTASAGLEKSNHNSISRDPFRTTVAVCPLCFQLYQAETKLREATDQLARASGVCHSAPPDSVGKKHRNKKETRDHWNTSFPSKISVPNKEVYVSSDQYNGKAEVDRDEDIDKFEGRYLSWSALFGEKKAKKIQKVLAAAKNNGNHAEVVTRTDLERHLTARATSITKQQRRMLSRLLRVDSGLLQPNAETLHKAAADSFALKSRIFRESKMGELRAKTCWEIANHAVKGNLLRQLLTLNDASHENSSEGFDLSDGEGNILVKGKHYDFSLNKEMVEVEDTAESDEKDEENDDESRREREVQQDEKSNDLSFCRLMIAMHELLEVPPLVAPHVVSLRVSYTLFGRRHQMFVRINKEIHDEHADSDTSGLDHDGLISLVDSLKESDTHSTSSSVTPMSGTFKALIEARIQQKKLGELSVKKQHVFQFLAPHAGVDTTEQFQATETEDMQGVKGFVNTERARGGGVLNKFKDHRWVGEKCGGLYKEDGTSVGGAGGGVNAAASRKYQLSGLAQFLRENQRIELSVEVEISGEEGLQAAIDECNSKGGLEKMRNVAQGRRQTAAEIWAEAVSSPMKKEMPTYLMRGKCSLSLDQLSSDGSIKQIGPRVLCALRVPSLPTTPLEANTLLPVLLRFSVSLSRARTNIDKETLPDPLLYFNGVYVPLDSHEWRPCDPFPESWMETTCIPYKHQMKEKKQHTPSPKKQDQKCNRSEVHGGTPSAFFKNNDQAQSSGIFEADDAYANDFIEEDD